MSRRARDSGAARERSETKVVKTSHVSESVGGERGRGMRETDAISAGCAYTFSHIVQIRIVRLPQKCALHCTTLHSWVPCQRTVFKCRAEERKTNEGNATQHRNEITCLFAELLVSRSNTTHNTSDTRTKRAREKDKKSCTKTPIVQCEFSIRKNRATRRNFTFL